MEDGSTFRHFLPPWLMYKCICDEKTLSLFMGVLHIHFPCVVQRKGSGSFCQGDAKELSAYIKELHDSHLIS